MEDIGNRQNSMLLLGNVLDSMQPFQLVQSRPHAARPFFDPGGLELVRESSHKDARGRKSKTGGNFVIARNTTFASFVLGDILIVLILKSRFCF
ncbi:hypothetical protein V8E53_011149 [Lactarius tabidus]